VNISLVGGRYNNCVVDTEAKPGQAFWVLGRKVSEHEQYIVAEDGLIAEVNE
jgi:hypothetical protein